MKVYIEDENKDFDPIKLVITIENKRELEFFWAMFNNTDEKLLKYIDVGLKDEGDKIKKFTLDELRDTLDIVSLWAILDEKLTE